MFANLSKKSNWFIFLKASDAARASRWAIQWTLNNPGTSLWSFAAKSLCTSNIVTAQSVITPTNLDFVTCIKYMCLSMHYK